MKFLKFILIVAAIFIFVNWETYGPKIHDRIDMYIPEAIQLSVSEVYGQLEEKYIIITDDIDTLRSQIKDWSLEKSDQIVKDAGITEPRDNTFSPVLSNLSLILASEAGAETKLLSLLLIPVTLFTWNRTVTLVLLGYLLYRLLKSVVIKIKTRNKKSFFDRIGENISRDNYDLDSKER